LEGTFVCVTDTLILAGELGVLDRYLSAAELVDVLARRARDMTESQTDEEFVHAARVLLMQAVISGLFSEARFIFRSDVNISWPAGYFSTQCRQGMTNSNASL